MQGLGDSFHDFALGILSFLAALLLASGLDSAAGISTETLPTIHLTALVTFGGILAFAGIRAWRKISVKAGGQWGLVSPCRSLWQRPYHIPASL
jgi:hypothetical protein